MNKKANIFPLLLKIFITIATITCLECIALIFVAMIPQKSIEKQVNESADILLEQSVFFSLNEKDIASKIDRYADSILLNIAYSYDSKHPVESVMHSSYYHEDTQNENLNLKEAVRMNLTPNTDYIRYWHGSNIILKPLLLIMNIKEIYILNAILLFILLSIFLILLQKRIHLGAFICMILSCVTISIWYVPFSLEYTCTFVIMLIFSIISLYIYKMEPSTLFCFFVAFGNITAYFDFLTTETLTFSLPIICIISMQYKNNILHTLSDYLQFLCKTGIAWLTGYASAWIMKWSISSIVLNINTFQLALHQANTRFIGQVEDISFAQQTFGSFARNISCLVPFNYLTEHTLLIVLLTINFIAILYYLFRKKKSPYISNILFFIALIPYIRFVILSNHSYIHYFFTYRAQLTSIFALGLAFIYGIDQSLIQKEWSKLWKTKKKK